MSLQAILAESAVTEDSTTLRALLYIEQDRSFNKILARAARCVGAKNEVAPVLLYV